MKRGVSLAVVAVLLSAAGWFAGCQSSSAVPGLVNRSITFSAIAYSGLASAPVSLSTLVERPGLVLVIEYDKGGVRQRLVLGGVRRDDLDGKGVIRLLVPIPEHLRVAAGDNYSFALENDKGPILKVYYQHPLPIGSEVDPRVEILLTALSTAKALVYEQVLTRGQTYDYPSFEQLVVSGQGSLDGVDFKTYVNRVTGFVLGLMQSGGLSAASDADVKTLVAVQFGWTTSSTASASSTAALASATVDYVASGSTDFGKPESDTGGGGSSAPVGTTATAAVVTPGAIVGRVISDTGVGAANAQVWLETVAVQTMTAADGSYIISALPSGSHRVFAQWRSAGNVLYAGETGPVSVTNNQTTNAGSIILGAASSQTSARMIGNGAPVVGAQVSVKGQHFTTDAGGFATWQWLPSQPLMMDSWLVEAPGFQAASVPVVCLAPPWVQTLETRLNPTAAANRNPHVTVSVNASWTPGLQVPVSVIVHDPDGDTTTVNVTVTAGSVIRTSGGATLTSGGFTAVVDGYTWTLPGVNGTAMLAATVSDGRSGSSSVTLSVNVGS